ncbi:7-cyano-7-deazaguanine/7-aminomethyl-7-deazaguanine transporter [Paraferrimonas sp. SM1919]|uniref:7-cyano-7-deazaguanine/7-aminomethyl-7- deazaguanine transporter n=1 Tax=Paraferrimonas sp. SM1919 TaxID=2662263 RepID=UPI0013D83A91|nr:7-cyano-7-deazaguanine/7-aminomethyl-7-deazaguanine transporter [Paraferrimonas sp. SM1919]
MQLHSNLTRSLIGLHIVIITLSNFLVQLPFELFGFHTTWGAFSFPLIYLASDLTVRLYGAQLARKVIFFAMLPALIISYLVNTLFQGALFQGMAALSEFNVFSFRIAFASFAAYALGQLVDIKVFSQLRNLKAWWPAPVASNIIGNLIDTIIFFSVAFYASSDAYMAQHWPEIATVDYFFKLLFSLLLFIPIYGWLMQRLTQKLKNSYRND